MATGSALNVNNVKGGFLGGKLWECAVSQIKFLKTNMECVNVKFFTLHPA
jgi:hypothetical protein